MRIFTALLLASVCFQQKGARGQLLLEPEHGVPCVFGGSMQQIPVAWHNAGSAAHESVIRTRMLQLSSTIAMPLGEAPWKTLRMLPGQTVLETAEFEFPPVKTKTRFSIQWLAESNHIVGNTEVDVYPTKVLWGLKSQLGENTVLGVFDPRDELKPPLADAKVEFVDLENTAPENFSGQLAIIGPLESAPRGATLATAQVKTLSEHGVAVVWVVPAASESCPKQEDPQPSFYSLPGNQVTTVIVEPEMVANLAQNPRSQLNLIYFCKLALHPQARELPVR